MLRSLVLFAALLGVLSAFPQDLQTVFEKSNKTKTADYPELMRYSALLASSFSQVHLQIIGHSPAGYAIPMLIVDKQGLNAPSDIRAAGRRVLLVQAGIHAGEPDGTDAGLMLVRDMLLGKLGMLLSKVSLIFIPSLNVDGLRRFGPYHRANQKGPELSGWRTNSLNLNLNRDYMKAETPEILAWLKVFNRWSPDFFVDCHVTDGADYQYVATYALETYGNMDSRLTQLIQNDFEPYLVRGMQQKGTMIFPYVTFRNWHDPRSGLVRHVGSPMISQGYTALRNCPGLLIETHMLKAFPQRVKATYDMLVLTLQWMNNNATLGSAIEKAREPWIRGDYIGSYFSVNFKTSMRDSSMVDFYGFEYQVKKSDLTGGPWFIYSDKKATFRIPLFDKQVVSDSVQVPRYYLIPAAYSALIDLLRAHGLHVRTLDADTTLEVHSYLFGDQQWAPRPFEGHQNLQHFSLHPLVERRTFPKGSALLSTRQAAAPVLLHLLEPRADNSLVWWGYFNSWMERKEYIESYVMEPLARQMIRQNSDWKEAFDKWKKENPEQASSQWSQILWWYKHSIYRDRKWNRYPIAKIM